MKFIDEEVIKRLNIDHNLSSDLENLLTNGFYGIYCHQNIIIVYQASNGLDVICANFDMFNNHVMRSYFKDIDTANKTLQSYKDIIDRKDALEVEKNQKKLGLNAIFPNAEYVYSESNLDIPEPTITFQTPDQPELGFNSPTWSDVSKPEPAKGINVPTKSIWKDVSESVKEYNLSEGDLVLANMGNAITLEDIEHVQMQFEKHQECSIYEKYCTLTDFVNQVEDMEARLRKLEGK